MFHFSTGGKRDGRASGKPAIPPMDRGLLVLPAENRELPKEDFSHKPRGFLPGPSDLWLPLQGVSWKFPGPNWEPGSCTADVGLVDFFLVPQFFLNLPRPKLVKPPRRGGLPSVRQGHPGESSATPHQRAFAAEALGAAVGFVELLAGDRNDSDEQGYGPKIPTGWLPSMC